MLYKKYSQGNFNLLKKTNRDVPSHLLLFPISSFIILKSQLSLPIKVFFILFSFLYYLLQHLLLLLLLLFQSYRFFLLIIKIKKSKQQLVPYNWYYLRHSLKAKPSSDSIFDGGGKIGPSDITFCYGEGFVQTEKKIRQKGEGSKIRFQIFLQM